MKDITTDEEVIVFIMDTMYDENIYPHVNEGIFNDMLPNVSKIDIDRIFRKLKGEGLIKYSISNDFYQLSDRGMEIMRKNGTFHKYLIEIEKEDNRKKRIERIDRSIRNGNIIAALTISLIAIFVSQCPSKQTKEIQSLKQDIKSVSTQLDSVARVLSQPQNKSHK